MNCIQRKIYLYNVTFGLYMLDWWERCLFSILSYSFLSSGLTDTLVVVLLWFICYNWTRYATEFCKR
ncbi:hypothetical protein HHK36_002452 [Tetracentron sinense]|uniref:Uncharacterized protein n=1 Tax=Tetracentron sinense TaxID=13715 RepID=A0A835DMS2_TETSI|nr:hypothetical protein HHK36_002452 [Tetracentron sinense]